MLIFDYVIIYKKGNENMVVDALSQKYHWLLHYKYFSHFLIPSTVDPQFAPPTLLTAIVAVRTEHATCDGAEFKVKH